MAARWRKAGRIVGRERTEGLGAAVEVIGGLMAVVLGLLALIDVAPMTVLPAAALVLGIAVMTALAIFVHFGGVRRFDRPDLLVVWTSLGWSAVASA